MQKWLISLFTVFLLRFKNKPSTNNCPGQHSETREEIDPILNNKNDDAGRENSADPGGIGRIRTG